MNITQVLRDEAAHLADCRALEILMNAQVLCGQNRWAKLRRRQALPITELERMYIKVIGWYTKYKIIVQRAEKAHTFSPNLPRYRFRMEYWKNTKNSIESGERLTESQVRCITDGEAQYEASSITFVRGKGPDWVDTSEVEATIRNALRSINLADPRN